MGQTDFIGKITDSIAGFFAYYIPSFSNVGNTDNFILKLPQNIKNYSWNLIDHYIFDFSNGSPIFESDLGGFSA